MKKDKLYLGNSVFPVSLEKATLAGYITRDNDFGLDWSISIQCGEQEWPQVERAHWRTPRLYCESFSLDVRDWHDIEGVHYYSFIDDEDPPSIYVGVHDSIDLGDLHFSKRHNNLFEIDWSFVWEGKDCRMMTHVTFTQITIALDDVTKESLAKEKLAGEIDLAHLQEPQKELAYGDMPSFVFKPKF